MARLFRRLDGVLCALTIAAAQATPAIGQPHLAVFKSINLDGAVRGIVRMHCTGGVAGHCDTGRATRLLNLGEQLELLQDPRITPEIRQRLWGVGGADLAAGLRMLGDPRAQIFAKTPARNARAVLRDRSGKIVAQLELPKPLADVEPLFTNDVSALPSFLAQIDYSAGTVESGIVGYLIEMQPASLSFARFDGSATTSVRLPDGRVEVKELPETGDITLPSRGELELRVGPRPGSQVIRDTYCMHYPYTAVHTGQLVSAVATVHAEYRLQGTLWQRDERIAFEGCDF